MFRALGAVSVFILAAGAFSDARANPYDISLRGVGRPAQLNLSDPAVRRYRRLGNEVTMAMLPGPLAPAETLGLNGFEFGWSNTFTNINWDSPHWRGQPGNPVLEGAATGHALPKVLWVPSFHLRKGLPMSMDVGLTGSYLAWSEMFMLTAEYKIAWHESFFRWVPAVASRLAISRLFGSSDLDVIAFEGDVLTSLPFGLGSVAQLTPYAGYGLVFTHLNSQVIDETPFQVTDFAGDQRGGPTGSLYNFPTIDFMTNIQGRLILGTRLIVSFVELVFEFNWMQINMTDRSADPSGPAMDDLFSFSAKLGIDV